MKLWVSIWAEGRGHAYLAGFASDEWGPFDDTELVVETVEGALAARWRRATADEVREYLATAGPPSQPHWEQLSLLD